MPPSVRHAPSGVPFTLANLAAAVHRLAPPRLAYDWDNVGLQIGDPAAPVRRVLVGLEVDGPALDRAAAEGCDSVVAHHPLVFRAPKRLLATDHAGGLILRFARMGLGLVAAHTNVDRAPGGTNCVLAALLGLTDTAPVETASDDGLLKVVVFVPRTHTAKLMEALHRAGAGRIGRYERCTFRVGGTGTFRPLDGATPFLGTAGGPVEEADEDRLETTASRDDLPGLLADIRAAHPYEEPAIDVIPVLDPGTAAGPGFGLGRVGRLPAATTLSAFAAGAAKAVGAEFATYVGEPDRPVRTVAVMTGSPGPALAAVTPDRADCVVTGELGYHAATEARDRGQAVVCVGHAASERVFAGPFARALAADPVVAAAGVEFIVHEAYPEPFRTAIPRQGAAASAATAARRAKESR